MSDSVESASIQTKSRVYSVGSNPDCTVSNVDPECTALAESTVRDVGPSPECIVSDQIQKVKCQTKSRAYAVSDQI